MAGGFRCALWLLGLSAPGTTPPPPSPPVATEARSGGWRLSGEQIARLRGGRPPDVQPEPEPDRTVSDAPVSAPRGGESDTRQGAAARAAPTPTPRDVVPITATVQALADADRTRRQALAQAAAEAEALVLMLALLEEI